MGVKYISKGKPADKEVIQYCIACAGSGYYDALDRRGRSIKCSACKGTGLENPPR